MEHTTHTGTTTAVGTLSGMALTVINTIDHHDILKTAVSAIVGAVIGYVVTITCKWLHKKIKDVLSR